MPPSTIAVFGSSEPRPGEPAYAVAHELGSRLAAAGYAVITGAYGGVMQAASQGAREAGGTTIGVTCAIFDDRRPNPHIDHVVATDDLHERTRELIERAHAFVVLPGKSGTLAELALLWALERAGCLNARPVILLGRSWQPLVDLLSPTNMMETRITQLCDTPEAAIELLAPHRPGTPGH